jgi:hypothetical protein
MPDQNAVESLCLPSIIVHTRDARRNRIAAAVTIAYNLIQALDSRDGAAGDYREAVTFLKDLKRTLEPLQTFAAWNAYPAYGVGCRPVAS